MNGYYVLDGHAAVLTDLKGWAYAMGKPDWRVGFTRVGRALISTVFLGLDHSFREGPPLLFETMVFGGPLDDEMERYTTWDEAAEGHARMVRRVRAATGLFGRVYWFAVRMVRVALAAGKGKST